MGRNEILATLRAYKNKYAEKYGIISLGIFGSVARDQTRDDSDLDICVTTKTPNPFVLAHIQDDLEKIVHRRVDIVRIRERMNPLHKQRIEQDGIYV